MLNVVQAFDQMRQSLELTDAQRSEASAQQNVVRGNLDRHLGGITRDFLSGSYARRTAIRPLHDIDLFVVLDPTFHRDVYPSNITPPSACLKKVQRTLATAYPGAKPPELQDHSVHIDFTGTGIGYDVVPAFENRTGVFQIPDRRRDAWILTNPEAHVAALGAANGRAGDKLNPMIKMAKQWRVVHQVPLRSFHLEVMAYGAFKAAPARFPDGMRTLFAHLAAAVLENCPDPAGVGPNIDAGMTQPERTKAREKLVEAEQAARRALEADGAGWAPNAHSAWRGLFGGVYTEG